MVYLPKNLRSGPASRKYGPALALGTNMVAGMVLFVFIGHQIDKRTGGETWTLAGLFIGMIFGGYEVWKVIRQFREADESENEREPEKNKGDGTCGR